LINASVRGKVRQIIFEIIRAEKMAGFSFCTASSAGGRKSLNPKIEIGEMKMKRLYILTALVTAFACSSLEAQTILEAKIPFAFNVGSTAMPAGEYQIKYSNHIMTMQSKADFRTVNVLVQPKGRSTEKKAGVLEFRCYGAARFFAGIWAPESAMGEGLAQSSREKELASRVVQAEPTVVALRSR
jgi:hypothetical protein